MKYRQIYENECGISIPKDYEIHHIDFDRGNNDISNLVMLPRELHYKYHKLFMQIKNTPISLNYNLLGLNDIGNGINEYMSDFVIPKTFEFIKIWNECSKYVDYRDYLLGKIPNIHNIEVNNE